MPSERARDRHVLRYYRTWFDSFQHRSVADQTYLSLASRNDGSAVKSSRDKALVAFAQLSCLRLNAKRALITLLSTEKQYILAEATRTTSLVSDHNHAADDGLWHGENILQRSHPLWLRAVRPEDHATGDKAKRLPSVLVIQDTAKDETLANHPYTSRGMRFFASVPIISRSGFRIGICCVIDDVPRPDLAVEDFHFLQDISTTVLDHLDQIQSNAARQRGERMIEGLTAFMEKKSTIDYASQRAHIDALGVDTGDGEAPVTENPKFRSVVTDNKARTLRDVIKNIPTVRNGGDAEGADAIVNNLTLTPDPPTTAGATEPYATSDGEHGKEPNLMVETMKSYSRAANILRQCTSADGVVFYNAARTDMGHSPHSKDASHSVKTNSAENLPSTISHGDTDEGNFSSSSRSSSRGSMSSESSGENGSSLKEPSAKVGRCQMLGFSIDAATINQKRQVGLDYLALPEHSLRRFIRRYPEGKVFHYTDGGVTSSSENDTSVRVKTNSTSVEERPSSRALAEDLLKVVPDARNVIFLPLWDPYLGKWGSGCFVWSGQAHTLLTAQDDLSYLKTFGNTIMNDLSRLRAQVSDQAKSLFISQISHELRSPLHGILGSAELLNETALDPHQAALITTVEICGKTLLDTVEHVLDHSKINNMSSKQFQRRQSATDNTAGQPNAHPDRSVSSFDLAFLVEDVTEAIYAGQTFRTTGSFHHTGNLDEKSDLRRDQFQQGQSVSSKEYQRNTGKFSGKVRIILDIEPREDWVVHTQTGAIRRIVMNLLGNSLKYTEKGFIQVSLSSPSRRGNDQSHLSCCIVVKDTGRGMSQDFAQNHAFTAFTQEDSFNAGTGLGLSIVRQLVQALGGSIDLHSEPGKGTEVRVWLSLPRSDTDASSGDSDFMRDVARSTYGLSLCFLNPYHGLEERIEIERDQLVGDALENSIRTLAQQWFKMEVFKAGIMSDAQTDVFIYAEPPPIEHLAEQYKNTAAEYHKALIVVTPNAFESAMLRSRGIQVFGDYDTAEILSQPCGPRKLGRALYRVLTSQNKQMGNATEHSPNDVTLSGDSALQTSSQSARTLTLHAESRQTLEQEKKIASTGDRGVATIPDAGKVSLPQRPQLNIHAQSSQGGQSPLSPDEGNYSPITGQGPILLVDDNEINLKLLVAFIRKGNFNYSQARDGQEALDAYIEAASQEETRFKQVCIDLSMPVMDGLTATRAIRAFERKEKLPPAHIIALTGLASEATQKEAYESGIDDFLTKPVVFKTLLALLRP